ncbi:hypothetical protein H310_13656 [Aphanomyces invadans]|uniref:UDENN domain-containing protein n=1 Tax=Aphanomyces invadans TaxID=157072 RepID=A0A024TER2_9STRA|nr:hypothetical protein H310_13656 [Aphanomyces invadans]ETV91827.1 hypothetical protein H310_13656 [Aphanomyces invadans]|eukprot:XP_008879464.1 hypothetical protein H310_13656 [Aphanomyces invadans]
MDAMRSLQWIALLEKIDRRHLEATWVYPSVPKDHLQVLLHRINMDAPRPDKFFVKFQDAWVYASHPLVATEAVVVVASKCFDPEKYAALLDVLVGEFEAASSSPLALLRVYLELLTAGQYTNPSTNVSFVWNKNQAIAPYVPTAYTLQTFMHMFQDDSAIVWLAILAKKRVVVVSDTVDELLETTRCLPQFAWHRQDWNILRPFTRLTRAELHDLDAIGVYIAGVLVADLVQASAPPPYDVLVDVSKRSVVVAEGAAGLLFAGMAWHNECTEFVARLRRHHQHDANHVLDDVANKTLGLIDSLRTNALTTVDGIEEPLMWAVAVAEELV